MKILSFDRIYTLISYQTHSQIFAFDCLMGIITKKSEKKLISKQRNFNGDEPFKWLIWLTHGLVAQMIFLDHKPKCPQKIFQYIHVKISNGWSWFPLASMKIYQLQTSASGLLHSLLWSMVNIGSSNGLLPDGTQFLTEPNPILTHCQVCRQE